MCVCVCVPPPFKIQPWTMKLKNPFFSVKTNKCPGHDEINFKKIRVALANFVNLYNICLTCLSKRVYFRTTSK